VGHLLEELRSLVLPRAVEPGANALGIPGAWAYRADGPERFRKSSASTLSVGIVLQGKKEVDVGGELLEYDVSHCIVLTGELEYAARVIEASPARPYLSLVLSVPPDLVARTLLALADTDAAPQPPVVGAPRSAFLANVDDGVLEPLVRFVRSLDDAAERRVIAPLAIEELVFRLLRSDAASALRRAACRGGDEGRIADTMAFIRANTQRKLTVGQLAKRAGMSPSHFAHRFRDVAHVSPMRYVKHVRLEQARVLLVQSQARTSEIADRVGYSSLTHFTRDFKQHFGLAPGRYAREVAGSGNRSAALALAPAGVSA
jgi:AraC-like DNA-binding protein